MWIIMTDEYYSAKHKKIKDFLSCRHAKNENECKSNIIE